MMALICCCKASRRMSAVVIDHGEEWQQLDAFLNYLRQNRDVRLTCERAPCLDAANRINSLAWYMCLHAAAKGDVVCQLLVEFILSDDPSLLLYTSAKRLKYAYQAVRSQQPLQAIKDEAAIIVRTDRKYILASGRSLELLSLWYKLVYDRSQTELDQIRARRDAAEAAGVGAAA
jgi:hypothetical protein